MRQAFLGRLGSRARELVEEIEAATGFEIEFRQSQRGRLALPYENHSDARTTFSHTEALIEHDADISEVPVHSLVHEILHLHRGYVERVPFVMPRRATEFDTASALDNDIEHLVIYRRQIEICPTSSSLLDEQLAAYWTGASWANIGPKDLLFNHIVRFAATKLYGSANTRASMRAALAATKILSRIRTDAEIVISLLSDKRAVVARIFDTVGIGRQSFKLRVLYPREHRFEDFDL